MHISQKVYWPVHSGVPGTDSHVDVILYGNVISHDEFVVCVRAPYGSVPRMIFRSRDSVYETEAEAKLGLVKKNIEES